MLWKIYLYCKSLNMGKLCTVDAPNLWTAQEKALMMNPGYELYNA